MNKPSTKKSNTIEFIEKAKLVHGDKYEYTKVEYVNNKTKVCIICHEHGEFWQTPNDHLRGRGCPICSRIKAIEMSHNNGKKQKLTTNTFIERAKVTHGEAYDYSKVNYVNFYTDIKIICQKHGPFFQKPSNHLLGCGCPTCSNEKQSLGKELFITKAKIVHGNKYDYSKVGYVNNHTKICIICPEHGEFWQTPNSHLNGEGCYECGKKNFGKYKKLTETEVLEKFKLKHGEYYDYSSFKYNGYDEKSEVICKEHGPFFITPHEHIQGRGCKHCANKYLIGETKLKTTLERNFDNVLYQVRSDIDGFQWLGKQSIDFYIPEINIAIEYQGEQHFIPIRYWGDIQKFNYTRKLDIEKNKKATDNNLKIIYFRYGKIDIGDFPYEVIFNEEDLLNRLKEEKKKGILK